MNAYIYNADSNQVMINEAKRLLKNMNITQVESLSEADIAIAPFLTKKLSKEIISVPRYGTLIFHPSLLPRHRGKDAIKWAFKLQERYTGVTWFWASESYDTGDICEQEVVAIQEGETPWNFYTRAVVPVAMRTLRRVLFDIQHNIIRRIPQYEEHASYEPPFETKK